MKWTEFGGLDNRQVNTTCSGIRRMSGALRRAVTK